jgi:hypothetical protein
VQFLVVREVHGLECRGAGRQIALRHQTRGEILCDHVAVRGERVFHQSAQVALADSTRQPVHGNDPPGARVRGVARFVADELELWIRHLALPAKERQSPADQDLAPGLDVLREVGLVEPHHLTMPVSSPTAATNRLPRRRNGERCVTERTRAANVTSIPGCSEATVANWRRS